MKQLISTTEAPAAIGAYSQAILANGMLYTSGQIPIDPKTGKLCESDIALQTRQVFQNIENILKVAGLNLSDIVKTTVFIADMSLFSEFNEVYKGYFTKENAPARSCVAVKGLPMGALIEIECVAVTA
ncbi:MAG: RidA family protein [Prevotellaceae bacterium]|jgi:2-iminobutanoate/2-iminopropanoate deaminase|nr:RidA family protein [Prevotellaceae bacterium]